MAGPTHILNGGIIATLLDCHSICTAVAHAFHREGRAIDDSIWYVTGGLNISYQKPTPIHQPVLLKAEISEWKEKKTVIAAALYSGETLCAKAETIAVRVPEAWREKDHHH
jgi:acyl-coenzyme A thioesterase PaaI-like protein